MEIDEPLKDEKWSPTAKAVVPINYSSSLQNLRVGATKKLSAAIKIRANISPKQTGCHFSHSSTGKPVVFCEGG